MKFYASITLTQYNLFGKNLAKLIKHHFPALDLKLVPKNPLKLGSLFKFKDKLPMLMQSKVAYMFTCPKCKVGTYLGATKRLLKVRVDSHLGISYRTGCTLSRKEFSNIREHCNKCRSKFSYDCFKIVGQTMDEASLFVLESLLIKKLVPSLNGQGTSTTLYVA